MMKLEIPSGPFAAYLFDCDGTIADSMPLHYVAWRKALAPWNCDYAEELHYSWGGRPTPEIISALNARDGLAMPVEATAQLKEEYYYELLHQLEPVPEVLEIVRADYGRIPFAVVSGSNRESVLKSLEAIGLAGVFPLIISSEEYERPKPAPDAYLVAAARLGVAPADCLVFEDTEIGIQSADAAGMQSVRVPSPMERRNQTQVFST
jgi:HAD superfamily hydrolase (TIGR01509 family)